VGSYFILPKGFRKSIKPPTKKPCALKACAPMFQNKLLFVATYERFIASSKIIMVLATYHFNYTVKAINPILVEE
jgi:hypothetical protein